MDIKDLKNGIITDDNSFYFKAKNELIEHFIKKLNKKNIKILILGNGPSQSLSSLNIYGKVYATDIDKKTLDLIPNNVFFKKKRVNICNIPFKNNFFDLVICCDVLEHVKNDKKAVENIFKVLKKNGIVLCTVPAFQFLYSSHDKALNHKRRYSKKIILDLFKKFKIIKFSYWNFFIFFPIMIKRILKKNSKAEIDKLSELNSIINYFFYILLKFENFLINFINIPLGLSLFLIARKN